MTTQVIINGKMDAANYSAYSGYAHLGAGWVRQMLVVEWSRHISYIHVFDDNDDYDDDLFNNYYYCYFTPKWHYSACWIIRIHRYHICYFHVFSLFDPRIADIIPGVVRHQWRDLLLKSPIGCRRGNDVWVNIACPTYEWVYHGISTLKKWRFMVYHGYIIGISWYIPDAPCMEYLPTFTPNNQPNVGKYSTHGASGYMEVS